MAKYQDVFKTIKQNPGIHYNELARVHGEENLPIILYGLKHGLDNMHCAINGLEVEKNGRSIEKSIYFASTRITPSKLNEVAQHWQISKL